MGHSEKYYPGICAINTPIHRRSKGDKGLIDGIPNHQGKDDVRHRGTETSSFKSKLLSLVFSALISGDCSNVKLGDARFINVASPSVLAMPNGIDDSDDQFASFLFGLWSCCSLLL